MNALNDQVVAFRKAAAELLAASRAAFPVGSFASIRRGDLLLVGRVHYHHQDQVTLILPHNQPRAFYVNELQPAKTPDWAKVPAEPQDTIVWAPSPVTVKDCIFHTPTIDQPPAVPHTVVKLPQKAYELLLGRMVSLLPAADSRKIQEAGDSLIALLDRNGFAIVERAGS